MAECIFCKIAEQQIPAKVIYSDNNYIIFEDLYPKAEVHWLAIPKLHIDNLTKAQNNQTELLGELLLLVAKIAQQKGIEQGFRIIINNGQGGGQEIFHLHYHLLAGKNLPGF